MDFTKKDIDKYIEKRNKLENDLDAERAYGSPSKTTLRKIEELDRIIHYEDYKLEAKDLRKKVIYYEELLEKHNMSHLRYQNEQRR